MLWSVLIDSVNNIWYDIMCNQALDGMSLKSFVPVDGLKICIKS